MGDKQTEGWAFPSPTARKCHFFIDGRALCGKWLYWGKHYEADRNAAPSTDDCKACRTKLDALTEENNDDS